FDGSAADFAAESYVGQYAVIGQDLYINVGQDPQTNVSIDVRAIITTLDGLNSWVDDQGWVHYTAKNDASFTYRDGDSYDASAETELIDRGDTSGGINDPSKFSKDALSDGTVYVDQGESLTIDYQFVVQGVD